MRNFFFILVLLMSAAESATPRFSLWTAFKSRDLQTATLNNLTLEPSSELRVTLEKNQPTGTLETAPITGDFDTAVVSWNALTPRASGVNIAVRARFGTRWSRYYRVGTWSTDPALPRTSYNGERDADGGVSTDTLELKRRADALQIRVILSGQSSLTGLAAIRSDSSQHERLAPKPSSQIVWGTELAVPTRSQMIYPDGGEVWCSPTSVTMILGYWDAKNRTKTADSVPVAAKAMWDTAYDGSGNWAFNAAYAGAKGYKAYVSRLSSLTDAETFIAKGVPLALSIAWGVGELDGVHLPKSNGHIVVLRGFTKNGDPIINDPAAKNDAGVRTIYNRAQLERAWIAHSGGIIYVIGPN
jgi:Peptidase_C39 like family